jgi:hypothetical protein
MPRPYRYAKQQLAAAGLTFGLLAALFLATNGEERPLEDAFLSMAADTPRQVPSGEESTTSLWGWVSHAFTPAGEGAANARSAAATVQTTGGPLGRELEITSPYGWRRDPMNGRHRNHRGVDIRAASGEAVYSHCAGQVVWVRRGRGGLGNAIKIAKRDGTRFLYAHLSGITVRKDQIVQPGQVIGFAGSSGRATGVHLHFEAQDACGVPQDPMPILAGIGVHCQTASPTIVDSLEACHLDSLLGKVAQAEPRRRGRRVVAAGTLVDGIVLPIGARLIELRGLTQTTGMSVLAQKKLAAAPHARKRRGRHMRRHRRHRSA